MKKEMLQLAAGVLTAGLILSGNLTYAQEKAQDETKTISLEEVVVSATRSEKAAIEVPRNVTVISAEDIEAAQVTQLSDLLRETAGISIIGGKQSPGAVQSLFMRGASANQTVILLDGVRITDPSSPNNAVDLSELSLAAIDRIEIVRGSHSAMYGTGAIGGVINIYSKQPKTEGLQLTANVSGESYGSSAFSANESVTLGYRHQSGLYIQGEAFNVNTRGLDATVDTTTVENAFARRDNDNFDKMDMSLKTGFRNEKLDVFASYKKVDQHRSLDDGAYQDDDNHYASFDRDLLNYGLNYELNDQLRLQFNGGFSSLSRLVEDDSSLVAPETWDNTYVRNTFTGQLMNQDIQLNYNRKHLNLVVGAGYYQEKMNNEGYIYISNWNYESSTNLDTLNLKNDIRHLFVNADLNGGMINESLKSFSLVLAGRINQHSAYGSQFNFEISPSYQLSAKSLLFASYATGFNAPSLYQMYAPNQNFVSGITLGNANLMPETSESFELGYKQVINDAIQFSVSLFQTQLDNSIQYAYLWDKSVGLDTLGNDWMRNDYRGDTYLNLGSMQTNGIEMSFTARVSPKFRASGHISLVSGKLLTDPASMDQEFIKNYHVQLYEGGQFITGAAEYYGLTRRSNTARFTLSYQPVNALNIRLGMNYVGQRSDIYYDGQLGPYGALNKRGVGEYQLFDLNASYQLNTNLKAFIGINNLLNTNYAEIYGYNTLGRSVKLAFSYQL